MTHYVIRLPMNHPDQPGAYWLGYQPNPAQPGGGCHIWKRGDKARADAVKFVMEEDAKRSGVGAPNNAYGRTDTGPDRGVEVEEVT